MSPAASAQMSVFPAAARLQIASRMCVILNVQNACVIAYMTRCKSRHTGRPGHLHRGCQRTWSTGVFAGGALGPRVAP